MKIGSIDTKALGSTQHGELRSSTEATSATTAAAEPSAKVKLTAAAGLASGPEGDFDAEKVERIATAIREGKFKVNAEAIADKLIAHAGDLVSRQVQ